MSTLSLVSDTLFNDLIALGLCLNKTFNIDYNKIFKNIKKEYYSSFLLGYFDGDGNVDCPKDGTISKSHVRYSGPKEQMEFFKEILNDLGIDIKFIEDKRKYTKAFGSLECSNTTSKYCLLKFLYGSNVNCLARKKKLGLELIKRIENNVTNRKENIIAVKYWRNKDGENKN